MWSEENKYGYTPFGDDLPNNLKWRLSCITHADNTVHPSDREH